eukprot:179012-Pleurochrysis_carterae.AAC.5
MLKASVEPGVAELWSYGMNSSTASKGSHWLCPSHAWAGAKVVSIVKQLAKRILATWFMHHWPHLAVHVGNKPGCDKVSGRAIKQTQFTLGFLAVLVYVALIRHSELIYWCGDWSASFALQTSCTDCPEHHHKPKCTRYMAKVLDYFCSLIRCKLRCVKVTSILLSEWSSYLLNVVKHASLPVIRVPLWLKGIRIVSSSIIDFGVNTTQLVLCRLAMGVMHRRIHYIVVA